MRQNILFEKEPLPLKF